MELIKPCINQKSHIPISFNTCFNCDERMSNTCKLTQMLTTLCNFNKSNKKLYCVCNFCECQYFFCITAFLVFTVLSSLQLTTLSQGSLDKNVVT